MITSNQVKEAATPAVNKITKIHRIVTVDTDVKPYIQSAWAFNILILPSNIRWFRNPMAINLRIPSEMLWLLPLLIGTTQKVGIH